MPPTARPWFRMYSDILENEKIDALKPTTLKYWLKLLALANVSAERGRLPPLKRIAYRLRVNETQASAAIAELKAVGLVDREGDSWVMHDWDVWQKDRDVAPALRAGKREDNHANVTLSTQERHANRDDSVTRVDKEKDKEKEVEVEREQDVRPRFEPRFLTDPPVPDEPGFVGMFRKEYETRYGKLFTWAIDAAQIEREYGAEACIEIAGDCDWEKHPNYLRPKLEDRKNGRLQTAGRHPSGRGAASTSADDLIAGYERYAAGQS